MTWEKVKRLAAKAPERIESFSQETKGKVIYTARALFSDRYSSSETSTNKPALKEK